MSNPFSELYKNYTTAELLEIVQLPSNYQPTAVEAAREILQSRNISEQDTIIAEKRIQETKAELPYIQKQFKRYNDYFFNSVDAIHQLGWSNSIPLLLVITYAFAIKSALISIYHAFDKNDQYSMALYGISLCIVPFLLYLFFSKSKWFWILLFSDSILGVFYEIKNLVFSLFTSIVGSGNFSTIIHSLVEVDCLYFYFTTFIMVFIKCLFVYYFSLAEIEAYFKITSRIKYNVVLVVFIIIFLASILYLYQMYQFYMNMHSNIYFQF